MRVLVADDEPQLRALASRIAASIGAEVVECGDGVAALTTLMEQTFDVLVLDIDMPHMSGLSLLRATQTMEKKPAVVVVSGAADAADIREAFTQGVASYLHKPYRPRELKQILQRLGGQPSTAATPGPASPTPAVPAPAAAEPAPTAAEPARATPPPAPPGEIFTEILESLRDGTLELPECDATMSRLVRLQASPDLTAESVSRMLETSATVAALAIRTANSALYSRNSSQVSNLRESVIRLGNRTVLNIALTLVHRGFYRVTNGQLQHFVNDAWARNVFCARLTRELGRRHRLGADPEDLYLAALFAGIGEVALIRAADKRVGDRTIEPAALDNLAAAVRKNHDRIGATLLRAWSMPELCVRAAEGHHEARAADPGWRGLQHDQKVAISLSNVGLLVYARDAQLKSPMATWASNSLERCLSFLEISRDALDAAIDAVRSVSDS